MAKSRDSNPGESLRNVKCNFSEGRISLCRINFVLKDRHMLAPLAELQLQ